MSSSTTMLMLLSVAIGAAVFSFPSASAVATPGVDCTSLVLTMAGCLSYVSDDSTETTPKGRCCSGLKQVLKTSPGCLCQAFQQSAQLGISLNLTKAMALPSACHVHAPASSTNCALSVSPADAPVGTIVSPVGALVHAPLGTPLRAPLRAPVGAPLRAPVGAPVHSPIRAPVGAPLRGPVHAPVGAPLRSPVGAPLRGPVHAPIRAPVGAPLRGPVHAPIRAPLRSPVGAPLRGPVHAPIRAPVRAPVGAPLRAPIRAPVRAPLGAPYSSIANAPLVFGIASGQRDALSKTSSSSSREASINLITGRSIAVSS